VDGDDGAAATAEVALADLPFRGTAEELGFADLVAQRAKTRLACSSSIAHCRWRRRSSIVPMARVSDLEPRFVSSVSTSV
jgi:hypothetical protein